jgi:Uma2 family endonuclease
MTDMTQEKLYTVEEFFNYTTGRDEDKLFELVRGEIREVAGSGDVNTVLGTRMSYFLNNWVIPRKIGYVTGADGSYVLHKNFPDTVRIPEVGFISRERLPKFTGKFIALPPDLAIEIVSPSETPDDISEKKNDYLKYGVRLVWIVYPKSKHIDIFYVAGDGVKHTSAEINGVLSGEDVLPGFTLAVKDIFEDVAE